MSSNLPGPLAQAIARVARSQRPERPPKKKDIAECPGCHEEIETDGGFLVTHAVNALDNFGHFMQKMCEASNTRVLPRHIHLEGACDNCTVEMEIDMTEEYYGASESGTGFSQVTCMVCNGKTIAVCEHCAHEIVKTIDDEDPNIFVWGHDDGLVECGGVATKDIKQEWVIVNSVTRVQIGGAMPSQRDANLSHSTLAALNDGNTYEVVSNTPIITEASPLAGTEKTNPLHTVNMSDNYEIEEVI